MKIFPVIASFALLAAGAHAANKEVVVSYPPETPRSVIDNAISRIVAEVST
jgi:hypothetical protein